MKEQKSRKKNFNEGVSSTFMVLPQGVGIEVTKIQDKEADM